MHRKEHGVELRADLTSFSFEETKHLAHNRHVFPGERQLPTNGQRQCTADHQHDQRRHQELDADDFMVQGEDIFL